MRLWWILVTGLAYRVLIHGMTGSHCEPRQKHAFVQCEKPETAKFLVNFA